MKRFFLEHSKGLLRATVYALADENIIGRGPQSTIRLEDPEISRSHARVKHEAGHWIIHDLESQNGTFVNGERVQDRALEHGDQIQLGQTALRFFEAAEPTEGTALEQTLTGQTQADSREIRDQMDLVRTFLNALPIGAAIINSKMEICYLNRKMASLGASDSPAEGMTLGELTGCNASQCRAQKEDSEHEYKGCPLHVAAQGVFQLGAPVIEQEIPWSTGGEGSAGFVRFSIIPLPYRLTGESLAQLTWEDVTSKRQAREALQKAHEELEARVERRTKELNSAIEKLRREILDRQQAEEALRDSEEKYRLLVENANDAIFVAQDGVLKFPNPKTQELTGFSPNELAEMPFTDIIHPEDRDLVLDRHKRRLKGEHPPSKYSFRILNREGEELWTQLNTVLVPWEGRPATLNFLRDITEQKNLEAQLAQSQKMEAVGTLAGGIAHDFNNILAAIIGYTELALADVPRDAELAENLAAIRKAGNRGRDLVKQILTFARHRSQERVPVQIGSLVKETLKMLRGSLPESIEMHLDIQSEYGTVIADPTQIYQVLMNLCTNAAQAMGRKGGLLEVRLTDVEIDAPKPLQDPDLASGSYLSLTVRDTGPGISLGIQEKVFDPYFTTKGTGVGTGLGLAVAQGIVKSHGGAVTVHSEPDEGATFQVLLPRTRPVEELTDSGEYESIPQGGGRILFIDDEEALVEMGRKMLERLGYEVIAKTESVEALEEFRYRSDSIDLVITDLTMPDMTGDELARKILYIRPETPIILCTGFNERMTDEDAKAIGIREVLMKPIGMHEMAEMVHAVLESSR